MSPDEQRAELEQKAALRLSITPQPGSKPEHFGFYAERVPKGFATVSALIAGSDGQFRAAASMFALYYDKFTSDCDDVRLITRVHIDLMAKGADRPTAWDTALSYHAMLRHKFGPTFNLDEYKVIVMTEAEATPEVLQALYDSNNDNTSVH